MPRMSRRTISIGDRSIGDGHPVFVIAEAGINHSGDMAKAIELVDAAAESGADSIKFQYHLAEDEMLAGGFSAGYIGGSFFDLIKSVELSFEQNVELKEYAESKGLIFLSTPFSREAADMLDRLGVLAFKTGSGELTNLPLQTHIARKGRPTIISTGMSTMAEVNETYRLVTSINADVAILHCVSTYPTPYEDMNLNVIGKLRRALPVPIGFSDHSRGIYAPLAAVALGANVIEKHFTIDRTWPGPDQEASLEPHEMAEVVKGIRAIEKGLGNVKRVTSEEREVQNMARESLISLQDIPAGATITEDMIWVKRPGTGIPAREYWNVVSRKAAKGIEANTLISWDDIE